MVHGGDLDVALEHAEAALDFRQRLVAFDDARRRKVGVGHQQQLAVEDFGRTLGSAHALICFLTLLLHRVMHMHLKASASSLSPQRALALWRQIQQLRVKIDHRPTTSTSQINAEQRGLQQLNLPVPEADNLA